VEERRERERGMFKRSLEKEIEESTYIVCIWNFREIV